MAALLPILPAVNAVLNTLSTIAIGAGVYFIRRGDRVRHWRSMWVATGLQAAFLVVYLTKTALVGTTVFPGPAWAKNIYFVLLGSHMVLAAIVTPLVIITVWRGWRGRHTAHRRIARWTYPLWLYVTVTGPLVYLVLHKFF